MTSKYPRVTDYFLLGKTLKSHGTQGRLRLQVEDRLKKYFAENVFIFLDRDGSKVPYQIAAVEEDAQFVIALQGIEGKDQSDKLSGKEIWIPIDQVKEKHRHSPMNIRDEWTDYFIVDKHSLKTFQILRTEDFPQQLMAVVMDDGAEKYVPLNDQLITDIDRKEKIIYMEIPVGLLEL